MEQWAVDSIQVLVISEIVLLTARYRSDIVIALWSMKILSQCKDNSENDAEPPKLAMRFDVI